MRFTRSHIKLENPSGRRHCVNRENYCNSY